MLKYGLCRTAKGSICGLSGMVFSDCETFKLELINDAQESRFQASKRSIMVLENGPSADIQEICFHAAKRSDM